MDHLSPYVAPDVHLWDIEVFRVKWMFVTGGSPLAWSGFSRPQTVKGRSAVGGSEQKQVVLKRRWGEEPSTFTINIPENLAEA